MRRCLLHYFGHDYSAPKILCKPPGNREIPAMMRMPKISVTMKPLRNRMVSGAFFHFAIMCNTPMAIRFVKACSILNLSQPYSIVKIVKRIIPKSNCISTIPVKAAPSILSNLVNCAFVSQPIAYLMRTSTKPK